MSEFTADEMKELRELLEKEKIRKLKQLSTSIFAKRHHLSGR